MFLVFSCLLVLELTSLARLLQMIMVVMLMCLTYLIIRMSQAQYVYSDIVRICS